MRKGNLVMDDLSDVFEKPSDMLSDACLAFARDLNEVLVKHAGVVAQGRADGVRVAVTPTVAEMLAECPGADAYMGNLPHLTDLSGFQHDVSPEQAEQVIGNTSIRIRLLIGRHT